MRKGRKNPGIKISTSLSHISLNSSPIRLANESLNPLLRWITFALSAINQAISYSKGFIILFGNRGVVILGR